MGAPHCLLLFAFCVGTASAIQVEGSTGRRRATNSEKATDLELTSRQVRSLAKANEVALRRVVNRMQYWSAKKTKIPPPAKPVKYLLFDPDEAGLNNLRMGWEMAGFAAAASGRTLVLPPARAFVLSDTIPNWPWTPLIDRDEPMSSKIEDFIDLGQLKAGLPTLTFEEFVKKERRELDRRNFSQKVPAYDADGPKREIWDQWSLFAMNELDRIPARNECDMSMWKAAGRFAYAPMVSYPQDPKYTRIFVCANWGSLGEPHFTELEGSVVHSFKVPDWGWKLLKDNFVWHPRFYAMAGPVVKELGLFSYYAIHARYNEFHTQFAAEYRPFEVVADYMANSMTAEKGASLLQIPLRKMSRGRMRGEMLAQRFSGLIPRGATLYIATDEKDPNFIQAFNARGINTVTWPQLLEQKDGPLAETLQEFTEIEKHTKWSGPTEQLICAGAKVFVGTRLSTFSGYIRRMRQYNGAPHQTPLYYNRDTSKEDEENVANEISNWEAKGGISAFDADSISAELLLTK